MDCNYNNIALIVSSIGVGISLIALICQLAQRHKDISYSVSSNVSVWIDKLRYIDGFVIINNNSGVPIYDIFVSIDLAGSASKPSTNYENCSYVSIVPPGAHKLLVPFRGRQMGGQYLASITFMDSRGAIWTRLPNGSLRHEDRCFRAATSFSVRKIDPPIESKRLLS